MAKISPPPPADDPLLQLIQAFAALPGIGEKTAQRMSYMLLQHQREAAYTLAHGLLNALEGLKNCNHCNNFSAQERCAICNHPSRDAQLLCVVEMPIDLLKIEQSNSYHGLYYVLLGRVSPLNGQGNKHINIDRLVRRCSDGIVKEVVLATSFTADGEITAHNIRQQLKHLPLTITRLARGIPAGSELEYIDAATLAHALWERHDKEH